MKIEQRRQIQIEASHEEVSARAGAWAGKCGFVLETLSDDQVVFARGGSGGLSIFTFDVADLPTKVSIALSGEAPITADCIFTVSSTLSISTEDDAKKVSEQFDVLIDYLTGAQPSS